MTCWCCSPAGRRRGRSKAVTSATRWRRGRFGAEASPLDASGSMQSKRTQDQTKQMVVSTVTAWTPARLAGVEEEGIQWRLTCGSRGGLARTSGSVNGGTDALACLLDEAEAKAGRRISAWVSSGTRFRRAWTPATWTRRRPPAKKLQAAALQDRGRERPWRRVPAREGRGERD